MPTHSPAVPLHVPNKIPTKSKITFLLHVAARRQWLLRTTLLRFVSTTTYILCITGCRHLYRGGPWARDSSHAPKSYIRPPKGCVQVSYFYLGKTLPNFLWKFRSLTWASESLWPVPHRCLGFLLLHFSFSGEDIHWKSKVKIWTETIKYKFLLLSTQFSAAKFKLWKFV